jgi:hypothetical protein
MQLTSWGKQSCAAIAAHHIYRGGSCKCLHCTPSPCKKKKSNFFPRGKQIVAQLMPRIIFTEEAHVGVLITLLLLLPAKISMQCSLLVASKVAQPMPRIIFTKEAHVGVLIARFLLLPGAKNREYFCCCYNQCFGSAFGMWLQIQKEGGGER